MLESDGLTVTTLDRVLETMKAKATATSMAALIVPPSSSVELLKAQFKEAEERKEKPQDDDVIAAAAQRINEDGEGDGGGLFDA